MLGTNGSRTSDQSDSENENGAPDGEGARSQSDNGSGDQDSSKTEHPAGGSSHSQYDHDADESKEWEELLAEKEKENESLRKSKAHGDRKITELGQDRSRLQKEVEEGSSNLEETVTQIVTRVLANQSGSEGSDGGDDSEDDDLKALYAQYGIVDDPDSDKSGGDKSPKIPKAILQKLSKVDDLEEVLYGMHVEREEESQLSKIQTELGVDETAARVLMSKAGDGADVVGLIKAANLTSLPKEARKIARESRQANRASVGIPTGGSRQASLSDEATLESEVKDIMELPNGIERADRATQLMDDYPESSQMLRKALGI